MSNLNRDKKGSLSRGVKPLSILTAFHGSDYLVYTEDRDDIGFWSIFFPRVVNNHRVRFVPTNGRSALDALSAKQKEGKVRFLIARDSDYDHLSGKVSMDWWEIETKFHSIENVMFDSRQIWQIITTLTSIPDVDLDYIEKWLSEFDQDAFDLMVGDLISQEKSLSNSCMKKPFNVFLNEATSHKLCQEKIYAELSRHGLKDDVNVRKNCFIEIKPRYHSRGHFFAGMVRHFIINSVKELCGGKSPNIDLKVLYSKAFDACRILITEIEYLSTLRDSAESSARKIVAEMSKAT